MMYNNRTLTRVAVMARLCAALAAVLFTTGYLAHGQITNPNYTIDCDEDCVEKEYPYQFCVVENGVAKFKIKCSDNPNSETDDNGNPMTVYKANILVDWFCIDYDYESSRFVTSTEESIINYKFRDEAGTTSIDLMKPKTDVEYCLNAARNAWLSACDNPENGEQAFISQSDLSCCLEIVWTEDEDLLKGPGESEMGLARASFQGSSATSCDGMDCGTNGVGGPKLYRNQNPIWLGLNEVGVPTQFYYNANLTDDQKEELEDDAEMKYYHLCSVLMHEIGHFLGMHHPDEANCPSGIVNSVMNSELDPFTEYDPGNGNVISDDDKCMFAKLYCCKETITVTGVYEESGSYALTDEFLCFNTSADRTLTVSYYTVLGSEMLSSRHVLNAEEDVKNLLQRDIQSVEGSLPRGLYAVVVRNSRCAVTQTFLLGQ